MSDAVPMAKRSVSRAGGNHQVPAHAREETARTLAATPGIRGEPSDAERGRTLLETTRTGALAALTVEGGFPFTLLAADTGADDRTAVPIPWGRQVDTSREVRAATIELLREARR